MRTQGPLTKTSGGVCCKRQGYLAGSQTHDLPFQGLGGACSLKDSPACRDFSWVGRISTRMVKYATNKIRRMSHLIFFQSGINVALSQCTRICVVGFVSVKRVKLFSAVGLPSFKTVLSGYGFFGTTVCIRDCQIVCKSRISKVNPCDVLLVGRCETCVRSN